MHQGIDLAFRRGESVPSPIEGRVQHQIHDEGLPDTWSGIVIEGTGDDAGRTVRIIGLSPVLPVDAPVAPGELLGTVVGIIDTPAHPILQLESEAGEVLFPLAPALVREVREDGRLIIVTVPEGLVEVNRKASSEDGEE